MFWNVSFEEFPEMLSFCWPFCVHSVAHLIRHHLDLVCGGQVIRQSTPLYLSHSGSNKSLLWKRTGLAKEAGWRGLLVCSQQMVTSINVHGQVCTPNLKMLTLLVFLFHLPWEFLTLVITCAYVPPSVNVNMAAEHLANTDNTMQGKYSDVPVSIKVTLNSYRLWSAAHVSSVYECTNKGRKTHLTCVMGMSPMHAPPERTHHLVSQITTSSRCFHSKEKHWHVQSLRALVPNSGRRIQLQHRSDILPAQSGTYFMGI